MNSIIGLLLGGLLGLMPVQEETDWIDRGRALLDANRGEEAQALFEAEQLRVPDAQAPRIWVARSWLPQGRINDTLDAVDAMLASGLSGPPIDYLFGMAWFYAAEAKRVQGDTSDSLRRNMQDCIAHLILATEADPSRYRDALRPLAKTAWLSQRLELANGAAEQAAKFYPSDARVWHLLGRIAHERFAIIKATPGAESESLVLLKQAEAAYRNGLNAIGVPTDVIGEVLLAETWLQLGRLLATTSNEGAIEALSNAVSLKPARIDYRDLSAIISPDVFLDSLELGLQKFTTRVGRDLQTGAAYWWLGYIAFRNGFLDRAERAFIAALASGAKDIESAWYYLGRLRFVRNEFNGAVAALRASWERDPAVLFQSLDVDKPFNVAMLDTLANWCASQTRTVDATIFFELSAEFSQSPEAWLKLAQFLTEQGNRLYQQNGAGDDLAERSHLTALAAFNRALEIDPKSPLLLINAARHLHRVLVMDLTQARSLYRSAAREALRLLTDDTQAVEASAGLRAIRTEALRALKQLGEPKTE
ncbi:MAG: tetratricopeptide (TPR) repeat protein [Planctomycetota bacterium]|jgi:tetratricopeptide (TPR) repeat protein